MPSYRIAPWSASQARQFIGVTHRRLGKRLSPSCLWALRLERDGEVVGCVTVGDLARGFNGSDILTVTRLSVIEGTDCGCSRLYGAAARVARQMGASGLVTYTHRDESGASLVAAGWVRDDLPDRDADWDSESKQRELPIDGVAKVRWWAPWSERLRSRSK
jgi:hypothetical protein